MIIPKKESDRIEFKPALNNAVIEIMSGGLAVTVYGIADMKTDLKISDIDNIILHLINENSQISITDIAKKIERGLTATKERISKLKAKGLIERVGADKGGYWKIKNK